MTKRRIAVIGLGTVGLTVAAAFAREAYEVIGFDIDQTRVAELQGAYDRAQQVAPADIAGVFITADPAALREAEFFIVTVPTLIDFSCAPDLECLLEATKIVARAIKKGDIVVFESTVYAGCTEEVCGPLLEQESGLTIGVDFSLAYSPERINPGDRDFSFEKIVKVVSAQDAATLEVVAETYRAVVQAGIYCAPSIRVAEAAKLLENTQRDLNIALMNEISLMNVGLGLDTGDVLAVASTKWNFMRFFPGLVGGPCIGVAAHYLAYGARRTGYQPQLILAARRLNDGMGEHVGRECVRLLTQAGRTHPTINVLGVTFKENMSEVRNSLVFDLINEIRSFGFSVSVHDPRADVRSTRDLGVELAELNALRPADAVVVAVAHSEFIAAGWDLVAACAKPNAFVLDIKGYLDRDSRPEGLSLWRM